MLDTIRIRAKLSDNVGLRSVKIGLRHRDESKNEWVVFDSIMLPAARLYALDTGIVVPPFAQTGEYQAQLLLEDINGRQRVMPQAFDLGGDIRVPFFSDVRIVNLPQNAAGEYLACRLDVPEIEGLVIDNTGLASVRAFYRGKAEFNLPEPPSISVLGIVQDTLDLKGVFGSELRIPNSVPDDELIQLVVQARDSVGNLGVKIFDIVVDCDDSAPEILLGTTAPDVREVETLLSAGVVQGLSFSIFELSIRDDEEVSNYEITFGPQGGTADILASDDDLGGVDSINITDEIGVIEAPLPTDAEPGDVFELTITSSDPAGNDAAPVQIEITTLRDEPPLIIISDLYINDDPVRVSSNEIEVFPSDRIRFEGKIEEDVAFTFISVELLDGNNNVVESVTLGTEIANELPFNLSDARFRNVFRIPNDAITDTVYKIVISGQDTRNDIQSRTLNFRVID